MRYLLSLLVLLMIPVFLGSVYGANPNLIVSAENPDFENHFAGSMVVEVIISDSSIADTARGVGEPDVTLNGKKLRMVQSTDGKWYAYFANVDKAKIADEISFTAGVSGIGLDFGVFCDRDTDASVFGIDFTDTDGFAVAGTLGVSGFTNGDASFSECTGNVSSSSVNNVIRNVPNLNTNPNIVSGQIGLDSDAWPLIQLFAFNDVTIQYNPGGPSQSVHLKYDEIPNITLQNDRETYPSNSEVFLTISDVQLNQDPTDEDSWTFSVVSDPAVFYQAFTSNGRDSANNGAGLVNLAPHLKNLGFEDNGLFSMTIDSIIQLETNDHQPSLFVTDGTSTFTDIVTFVETGPNSGVFTSYDFRDKSVISIVDDVRRGLVDSATYNDDSLSLLSASSSASISTNPTPTLSIDNANNSWRPGTKIPLLVSDADQNINSGMRDHLDLFRSTSIIPTLVIGNPITLDLVSDVMSYSSSTMPLLSGQSIASSAPDPKSARLFLDTRTNTGIEKISMNLGVSASDLNALLINPQTDIGTNWLNYDIRSLNQQLSFDISDTTMSLYFQSLSDPLPIMIAGSGTLDSFSGLVQISDEDVLAMASKMGSVFVVIDFDASDDSTAAVSDGDILPIAFDLFSFGLKNDKSINNAIYRFELEESGDNSGLFEGTLEFAVANQLNIADPDLIESLRPISDDVKFLITQRSIDDQGITISYADVADVGVDIAVSVKSDIRTSSGTIRTDSSSYGFGRPVTIILNDADLNTDSEIVDIYSVINDPNSLNVDSVGTKTGDVLLDVIIKGVKYQRCMVDGVQHGGLAATGFSLVETYPSSGIFEGIFKMPSQICNKNKSELMYTSGGNIDVRYYDFRDSSGKQNIATLSNSKISPTYKTSPKLDVSVLEIPKHGTRDLVLSGKINDHKRGVPLEITLKSPDALEETFAINPTGSGSYRAVFTLNPDSLPGTYDILLSYMSVPVGSTSFVASAPPASIRDEIKNWSPDSDISDDLFYKSLKLVVDPTILSQSTQHLSLVDEKVPVWIKNISKLWADGLISDQEHVNALEYLVKKGIIIG